MISEKTSIPSQFKSQETCDLFSPKFQKQKSLHQGLQIIIYYDIIGMVKFNLVMRTFESSNSWQEKTHTPTYVVAL